VPSQGRVKGSGGETFDRSRRSAGAVVQHDILAADRVQSAGEQKYHRFGGILVVRKAMQQLAADRGRFADQSGGQGERLDARTARVAGPAGELVPLAKHTLCPPGCKLISRACTK
jgi:hypothetical protein